MTTPRLTAASLLVALLVGATGALASTARESCCACLPGDKAMLSGPPPPVAALFCGEFSMGEQQAAEVRCTDIGGSLECAAEANSATISAECREVLLQAGVACPQQAGAPLAGPWALAGLAIALGTLGAAARRRR